MAVAAMGPVLAAAGALRYSSRFPQDQLVVQSNFSRCGSRHAGRHRHPDHPWSDACAHGRQTSCGRDRERRMAISDSVDNLWRNGITNEALALIVGLASLVAMVSWEKFRPASLRLLPRSSDRRRLRNDCHGCPEFADRSCRASGVACRGNRHTGCR